MLFSCYGSNLYLVFVREITTDRILDSYWANNSACWCTVSCCVSGHTSLWYTVSTSRAHVDTSHVKGHSEDQTTVKDQTRRKLCKLWDNLLTWRLRRSPVWIIWDFLSPCPYWLIAILLATGLNSWLIHNPSAALQQGFINLKMWFFSGINAWIWVLICINQSHKCE